MRRCPYTTSTSVTTLIHLQQINATMTHVDQKQHVMCVTLDRLTKITAMRFVFRWPPAYSIKLSYTARRRHWTTAEVDLRVVVQEHVTNSLWRQRHSATRAIFKTALRTILQCHLLMRFLLRAHHHHTATHLFRHKAILTVRRVDIRELMCSEGRRLTHTHSDSVHSSSYETSVTWPHTRHVAMTMTSDGLTQSSNSHWKRKLQQNVSAHLFTFFPGPLELADDRRGCRPLLQATDIYCKSRLVAAV